MDAQNLTEIRHRLKRLDAFAHVPAGSVLVPDWKDLSFLAVLLGSDVPALLAEQARLQSLLEDATQKEIQVRHRHRPVLLLAADGDFNVCAECDGLRQSINPDAYPVLGPCSTVRDLDGDTTTETREMA